MSLGSLVLGLLAPVLGVVNPAAVEVKHALLGLVDAVYNVGYVLVNALIAG